MKREFFRLPLLRVNRPTSLSRRRIEIRKQRPASGDNLPLFAAVELFFR